MSRPDEKGRGPVRRAVKEVFSKGAPAPAKLALPLSLFLLPPALAAQEGTHAGEDLPVVFTAPPPELEVSAATVSELRTLTAIARLERVAALEPELNDLKYQDPGAALMKLGIELPADVKVTIAKEGVSGGDKVTVDGGSFAAIQVYDAAGKLVSSESPEAAAGFRQRFVTQSEFDGALRCCWGLDQSSTSKYCASSSWGACSKGEEVCWSQYFSQEGETAGSLPCSAGF